MTDKDDDGFDIKPIAQVVIAEDYYPHVVFMEGVDTIALDQQWLYADYVDRRQWRFDPMTGEPLEQPDLARVGEIGVWGEGKEAGINRDDIIRLAREAEAWSLVDHDGIAALERFANLVSAEWQEKCNTYMELHDAVVKDNDRLYALNAELVEALKLADAMLSGANMNAKVVEQKVHAALAKAQGDNND